MQRANELDTVPSSDAFPDTVELPAFGGTPLERPAGNEPAPHPVAAVTAQLQKELRRSRLHRRLLIGCGFSGLYLFALFIFCLVGSVSSLVLVASFGFVVTAASAFFALHAASKSKRKAEKRLTGPIAVSALAVMLADVYFAPGSRPVFTTW